MNRPVILEYLQAMHDHQASDLYLTVGYPVTMRGEGDFIHLSGRLLSEEDIKAVLNDILTTRQRREYEVKMELNTSLAIGAHGRFRVNVMRQKQLPAIVIRRISLKIPDFETLKLPKIFEALSLEKRGLVLVSGITGSGKSTTLAAMVDYRNAAQQGHIITIEDPVEYFHEHKKSVVTQREVGVDTESYAVALKNALRQRPDVILVGEIRDREVMEQALMSAETGHLCLATLHSRNAYQAIERIVNFFPEDRIRQVRLALAANLTAIVSQRMIDGVDGKNHLAIEIMLNQGLAKELIVKGEISKIYELMERNAITGTRTFDQSLLYLCEQGYISEESALLNSDKPSDLKIRLLQSRVLGKNINLQGPAGLAGLDTSIIRLKD